MAIRLSDYYDGNYSNFKNTVKEDNLRQVLENKKRDIVRYLERLLNVSSHNLLEQYIYDTKIVFSNERKKHNYVSKYKKYIIRKLEEALDEICNPECRVKDPTRELIDALGDLRSNEFTNFDDSIQSRDKREKIWDIIEMIESNCRECNQCRHFNNDKISCSAFGYEEKCCGRKIFDIIDKYLREPNYFTALTAGEYDITKNTITLYLNVIKNSISDEKIEAVFAHELFHAYHMYSMVLAGSTWINNPGYNCKVVLESLAAYFEYQYAKDEMLSKFICDDLYNQWEKYDVDFWPYSGAKGLVDFTEQLQKHGVGHIKPFVHSFADSHEKKEDSAYEDIKSAIRYNDGYLNDKMRQLRRKYIDPVHRVHTYAKVNFGKSGSYDYYCDGQDIKVGEKYIVATSNNGHVEEKVVKVEDIHKETGKNAGLHFSKYKSILRKAAK